MVQLRKADKKKQSIGRSKGGITTKIHAVTDALGNPLKIILSAGNVHDSKLAEELLFGMEAKAVLADKGYNSKKIEALIKEMNSEVVIPPKKNAINPRDYDKHLYKERHVIECFFQKIKESRRVATRYDKLQIMYKNFVLIACCLVWLK